MVLDAIDVLAVARHHEAVGVLIDRNDRADNAQLVEHASLARHVFANLHARDVRLDRAEFAAIFDRSFRLQIVHVHVRRATRQVDHDRRLGGRRSGSSRSVVRQRLGPKHIGECETRAEGADLHEATPRQSIAKFLR